jgi:hypothetical protein
MNDSNLNEVLDWLLQTAKSAEAFVVDQSPEVARQIIALGYWKSLMGIGLGLLMVLVGIILLILWWIRYVNRESEYDDGPLGWLMAGIITTLSGIVGTAINLDDYIAVRVAPKVYLIDELSRRLSH